MLWGEAYRSVPAGSLANDDDELADAAGFGMDTEGWLAAKAEIMAPWMLCSDGRWYHPTVCQTVLDAWDRLSARRRAGAARQANYRARVQPGDVSLIDLSEGVTRHDPHSDALHERTRQDRTRQDILSEEADASSSPLEFDLSGAVAADPIQQAFDAYNGAAQRLGLPRARSLTDDRRKKLKTRLRAGGLAAWQEALDRLGEAPFLLGQTTAQFRADLDFMLQAKSFQRLIEGFYGPGRRGSTPRVDWV